MDVSFLETQSYFTKNSLQGEKKKRKKIFGRQLRIPYQILFDLHPLFSEKQEQKQGIQDMENKGNPSPTSPNIEGSQAGGEILQLEQTVPEPEFLVYARKNTQRKSKD